jgi:hypothetical protein
MGRVAGKSRVGAHNGKTPILTAAAALISSGFAAHRHQKQPMPRRCPRAYGLPIFSESGGKLLTEATALNGVPPGH